MKKLPEWAVAKACEFEPDELTEDEIICGRWAK